MPTPSWDLAIIVFFLIGIAFGYILQREKIIATLLSIYVALVVTQVFSGNVLSFFQGDKVLFNQVWVQSGSSPFTVRVVIFMLVIMLLSAKGGISSSKAKGIFSPIEIIGFSFLATALILSSIFNFMPPESREAFMASSRMANLVIKYYLWWVLLPPVAIIGLGFFRRTRSTDSD
ncbi:MAG TPA: hypothetical protein VJK26_01205 [Patescibacteria group bacterium]|nr:hypothetical protein [Patescibacteria group bacterium]